MLAASALIALASPPAAHAAGAGNQSQNTPTASPSPSASPTAAPNPFSSPTATPTPGPIGNGYAIVGFTIGNGSGGIVPAPAGTATPLPFPSSNASGFFIDLAGRFSPAYSARVRFGDSVLHGADNPVATLSYGSLYYTPRGGALGLGVGYASFQRSSSTTSANQFGLGVILLPDLRHALSPYGAASYFPSARTQGATAGLTLYEAGLAAALKRPGLIVKFGFGGVSYPNANTSPTSLGNLEIGVGASF